MGPEKRTARWWCAWAVFGLTGLFSLTGSTPSFAEDISSLKGADFVKQFIHVYHRGNLSEIFSYMGDNRFAPEEADDPEFAQWVLGNMETMVAAFNQGDISSMKQLYHKSKDVEDGTKERYLFHVAFDTRRAVLAQTDIITDEDRTRVLKFDWWRRAPVDPEDLNRFIIAGKSIPQYVFLAFSGILTLFCIGMLVLCVTGDIRRKWLWLFLILLGVGKFSIPWASGSYSFSELVNFNLLYLHILPIGFWQPDYEPWHLSITFPLGSICFFVKYMTQE